MTRLFGPGNVEKTSPSVCCTFYFVVQVIIGGNGKSLENGYYAYNGHENMLNGYGMIFCTCCCDFIWVLALVDLWVMVYSLWFQSLCWMLYGYIKKIQFKILEEDILEQDQLKEDILVEVYMDDIVEDVTEGILVMVYKVDIVEKVKVMVEVIQDMIKQVVVKSNS